MKVKLIIKKHGISFDEAIEALKDEFGFGCFKTFQSRAENVEIESLQLLSNEKLCSVMEEKLKIEEVEKNY